MNSQSNEQDITHLINTIFHDEMQYFNAAFDIIKNEVIPSINQTLESLGRAEQEYNNGQSTRETRLQTINDNIDTISRTYFSPSCRSVQDKIIKYYGFVNEEFEQLLAALNAAHGNAQNLIAFQELWLNYENKLQECVSGTSGNESQGQPNT